MGGAGGPTMATQSILLLSFPLQASTTSSSKPNPERFTQKEFVWTLHRWNCYTLSLSHFLIIILSHCLNATMSLSITFKVTLSHCNTVTLSHHHNVSLSSFHAVSLSNSLTVTLSKQPTLITMLNYMYIENRDLQLVVHGRPPLVLKISMFFY